MIGNLSGCQRGSVSRIKKATVSKQKSPSMLVLFIRTLQVRQRNDIMANGMGNGVHAKYGTHHERQVATFGVRKRDGLFDEVLRDIIMIL